MPLKWSISSYIIIYYHNYTPLSYDKFILLPQLDKLTDILTEPKSVYIIPYIHILLIPFSANINKQMLQPKGNKLKLSSVPIDIQLHLYEKG